MIKQTAMKSQLSAFQLKGSLLTLTVLELLKSDIQAIDAQFLSLVKKTPDLFKRMPIVIDLSKLEPQDASLDFHLLKTLLQSHGLVPVGIRGGSPEQENDAASAGFALLNHTRLEHNTSNQSSNPAENTSKVKGKAKNALPAANCAKLVTQPVRSGQQIYAKDADLIILASVSPGAEILADGNIHVYGTLHGRAMAGINGNKEARIFCRKLKAELVSIAGIYWVSEDLLSLPSSEKDQILQIYLKNDHLQIDVI